MDWDSLRATEFPVARRWAYFDHAAVAPPPRRAGDAMRAWTDGMERDGVAYLNTWGSKLDAARARVARLLNAEIGEVAFINSTTQGIGLVAEGFPWRDGDNVVTAAEEYPSNLYPWMNLASRGVGLRMVPGREGRIWIDDLAAAMDARTRLLTISHVEFASGFRNDLDALAELCRGRGVALFVDAIQGLGPLTLDVRRTPVDFLAADGHKWLLGPQGAGLLFVRRDWIERLRPLGVGANSVVGSYNAVEPDFTLKADARRWEGGTYNATGLLGLDASLALFEEVGFPAASARILDRAEAVRELAAAAGWAVHGSARPADRSGIVCLERPGVDPDAVAARMRERGVILSSRRGRLRVSPHLYTDSDDLERLAEGLREAC